MKARTCADIIAAFRRLLYRFKGALPEPTWFDAVVLDKRWRKKTLTSTTSDGNNV
jgi:hypothetical protein